MAWPVRLALACVGALIPVAAGAQAAPAQPASPLTIRIGDAEFLPGGFLEALAIVRSTNVASGPATTFATIPFDTPSSARTHMLFLSVRYVLP